MNNTVFIFIVSNMASILIGWLLGRTGRNTAVVAAAVEGEEPTKESDRRRASPTQVIAVLMMVVAGVTAVNGVSVSTQQGEQAEEHRRFVDCVTVQFNKLADALDARSRPQQEATLLQDAIWKEVAEAFRTPTTDSSKRIQDAVDAYNHARTDVVEAQKKNPLPDPPRDACSQLK
jgi:hypothetical protein